jgi:hypothetical protein
VRIDHVRALEIALRDAQAVYRDLESFRVTLELRDDVWHVDFEPANPNVQGGGPHYAIARASGDILDKRYEQ